MFKKPSAIIFDLDGTLVDSARDLSAALNHVLNKARRPIIDIAHVRHMVGDGAMALIKKGFSETGILPNDNALNVILQDFLAYYLKNIAQQTIIFPSVLATLQELCQRDIPLAICTNKPIKLAEKLVMEIGLAPYFAAITGGDSFMYRKPNPRHLTSTLNLMKCSPNNAIMIGDSQNDIIAAKKAGIPVICVSFGYSKIPVADLNADIIIDHYDEFFDALEKTIPNG